MPLPAISNRCLAPLAREVLTAFPSAFPHLRKARLIGNPVRRTLPRCRRLRSASPDAMARSACWWWAAVSAPCASTRPCRGRWRCWRATAAAPRFEVRHQTGDKHLDATRAAYAEVGVTADVSAFITDMAEALAWADLVVCRAGALTIAELAAAGVGAVLVPYPHAVDDHQTHNARFLVDAGAAQLLRRCNPDARSCWRDELRTLCADRAAAGHGGGSAPGRAARCRGADARCLPAAEVRA